MKRHLQSLLICTLGLALGLVMMSVSDTSAQEPNSSVLCFRRNGEVACIRRLLHLPTSLASRLDTTLQALVVGPTPAERAAGFLSAIPAGTTLSQVNVVGTSINVMLVLSETFLSQTLNASVSDQIVEQIVQTAFPFRAELRTAASIRAGAFDI